ncbi:Tat pathway signal protein [Altererythrobacter indicus]|uniref:Tat pathway signal protein n=1 Tax=Altericroceibacterium indicum TaxID=374177 RepID=A0A845A7N1_9SPHN|nr:Tat pathway signal protein [Altericroceibacterium indicum]
MFNRRDILNTGALTFGGLVAACAPRTITTPAHTQVPPPAANTFMPDDDEALISDIQRRAFQFFWDNAYPKTGLIPDRWPTPSFASIAAVGFGLTAYPIGESHGWITRDEAADRTLSTLEFFIGQPQGDSESRDSGKNGFFYHFLGVTQGWRFARAELSTIDTALLMAGVLFAQSWFDRDDAREARIRYIAEQLFRAIDWNWITPRAPFVSMGWKPRTGFIPADWNQYNEGMILYVLGLASPTHPLPDGTWEAVSAKFEKAWGNEWGSEPHLQFPPMFGHQYSHTWIDFRGIRDPLMKSKGIDYFENSRRATYAQRDYAIKNPYGWDGYGEDCWGLTACDGPGDFKIELAGREREFFSYSARGPGDRDDGTIAPTAALGSIAFAPEIVTPMIAAMHKRWGHEIYDNYGFLDSFNPTLTEAPQSKLLHGEIKSGLWVDKDYLGIDQGPIVAMIENHRTGLVWSTMRKNPHIQRGLRRAGFTGGWLD